MFRKRTGLLLGGLIAVLCALAACSENKAASAKCTTVTDGSSCNNCCKTNGASGYEWMNGPPCKCLGGS
jgi:hypothetical protein